jgi:phage gpG-like protein
MAQEPWVTVSLGPALTLLQRMQAKTANLEPVFNGPIANAVHEFFDRQFATEGAAGGEKWAPLAAKTLRWRAQNHRTGMPILQFSRELWGSLVKRSSPLGYRIADKDSLLMGTSVQHAEKHQRGTARMPARPIVPDVVPEADTQNWAVLIRDYLEAAA